MKNYYINIVLSFCVFISIFSILPVKASLPLQGKTIIVDAGHGGLDPGAIYKDIYEKNITLNISLYLEKFLSQMGATVILTRDSDKDLSNGVKNHRKRADFDERIKIINQKSTNLYLSIHLNFLPDTKYYGPQVFYNKENKNLAFFVQNHLNKKLNGSREIKKIPTSTYMYNKLNKKGILIECGFLSNKNEREKLVTEDYQKEIAQAIAEALSDYYI